MSLAVYSRNFGKVIKLPNTHIMSTAASINLVMEQCFVRADELWAGMGVKDKQDLSAY